MVNFDQELDTSGLNCPMPVMRAKKALKDMQPGQVLHLIATDPASSDDVPVLASQMNCKLEHSDKASGKFHFYIRKG